jgi:hypothetical protein
MKLYAYCLCEGTEAERLSGAAGLGGAVGVGGAPPRVLPAAGAAAVVGDYAGGRVAVGRENLLAHNRVNARVLALTTPLPFRFGTLVTPEQLEEYVRANGEAIREALARVRGCVEMGVKVMSDPAASGAGESEGEVELAGADGGAEAGADADGARTVRAGAGAAYLAARRRALLGDERLRRVADEVARQLAGAVGGAARDSSVRVNAGGALFVRAAHLVERGQVAEYRSRLREFGERRPDLRLLTSGPWPPYSFASR